VHALGIDRLALGARVQILQDGLSAFGRGRRPTIWNRCRAGGCHAEPRFDLVQMLVERTAELDQAHVVERCENHIARRGNGIHAGLSMPAISLTSRPRKELGRASVMITSVNRLMSSANRRNSPNGCVGAPGELAFVAFGGSFRPAPLPAADHALRNVPGLDVHPLLYELEPLLLHVGGHLVGKGRGGRAGTAAVDEAEGLIEAHIRDQVHGAKKSLIGLPGKAHDDVRGDRDARPDGAELAQLLLVFERGMARFMAASTRSEPLCTGRCSRLLSSERSRTPRSDCH